MVGHETNEPHTLALAPIHVRRFGADSVDVAHDLILKDLRFLCFSETWADECIEVAGHTGITCATRPDEILSGVAVHAKEYLAFKTVQTASPNLTAIHHRLCGCVRRKDQ